MKKKDPKQDKQQQNDAENRPSMEEQEEKRDKTFPGYPTYPASEDIMNQEEELDMDVEKVTRSSRINNEIARQEEDEFVNPADFDEGQDIPGAELDDESESIGEEDEENNYYSLGGDRHDDLDENEDVLGEEDTDERF